MQTQNESAKAPCEGVNSNANMPMREILEALKFARQWLQIECAIRPVDRMKGNHGPSDALRRVVEAIKGLEEAHVARPSKVTLPEGKARWASHTHHLFAPHEKKTLEWREDDGEGPLLILNKRGGSCHAILRFKRNEQGLVIGYMV